jgi:hypothetical protein
VLEMVALVLQRVERFVFDFPTRSPAPHPAFRPVATKP